MSEDECMLNDFVESEPEHTEFCGIELTVYRCAGSIRYFNVPK